MYIKIFVYALYVWLIMIKMGSYKEIKMKRIFKTILFGLLVAHSAQAFSVVLSKSKDTTDLQERFLNPPEAAKPWVFWFWMNGNVTEEGITADLEAMDRIGIGGALMMNVGLRTPAGPYDFNTPEWRNLYSHAAKECVRLGMKLTLHPLDGWATSGGQWMSPEQSMKILVWNSVDVEGSANHPVQLEQPFTKEGFYEDVAVLAFPAPADDPLQPDRVTINGQPNKVLFDGNMKTGIGGAIDVLAEFDEPVDLSTVVFARESTWPYSLQATARTPATIEVSADGANFATVSEFDYNVAIDNGGHFSLTASFPTRLAKAVRIRMDNKRSDVQITEIELRAAPRVNLWEVKSSLARERNHGGETFILDAAPRPGEIEGVDPAQVIDLTGKIAGDGTLDWNVPPGRWRIVRTGMTSTGKHTAPATHAGSGLEADKMNKEAIRHHWNSFGKGIVEENNIAAGNPIWSVHTDSWESQVHTWGTGFQEEFETRRGYSMIPWMPVLTTGAIIGSAEESERFLWDYRRTVADLIAENYYGEMRRQANGSGLLFQSEAAGRQMFMYDPLNYAAQTDIYVGEFWMVGDVRPDCKIASSAAHTYGRPFAAAEAWTSGNGSLNDAPFNWKPLGDHAFTVGINRVIIHRYCMQPFKPVEPGMTFGPYGINFERTQTFWENGGKAWVNYLTRCQSLLQTGTFVADVIHYIGHDAPNYLGQRDELWNPVPAGYDFDGCNLEILRQLEVEADGTLALPSGMRYRVLLLPNREHMVIEAAREVERLANAGATIVGKKPLRTPGLKDGQAKDAELAGITARVWDRVLDRPLEEVLNELAPPDFDYAAPANALVRYIHRRANKEDFYFVANGNKEMAIETVLRFRVTDRRPELWDPSTGAIRKVDAWRVVKGVTELPVHFDPAGSWFVVFREAAQPPAGLDPGLFDPAGSSPSIETNAFKNFTMALWLKSSAQLNLPDLGTPSVPAAGQNYAVYPAPGHEVWGKPDAGVGISAGKNGLIVIAHGERYFASPLIHGVDLSDWTHVAVTAQDNAMTLYVNGESVAQSTAPSRTLHASIGVEHTRGVAPFKGQAEAFFQSSETLHADAIRALMRRTALEDTVDTGQELSGPWTVSFPPDKQAPDSIELPELISWTDHPDDGVKYFSGTATYRSEFQVSSFKFPVFLDLGEVKEIAEVKLNGKSLGILWKPPFKVDVSGALVVGENTLEIKVTNLWPNRLIGDEKLHPDPSLDYMQIGGIWGVGPQKTIPQWVRDGGSSPVGRTTWILNKFYSADSPLLPSGLLGPVRLVEGQ